MEIPKNYENTEVIGDYETLEPGGYICKIISAKEEQSKNGKRMLVVAFDIAEGEHAGIYTRRYEELKKSNTDPNKTVKYPNNGVYRVMVEDKDGNCSKFFKTFITSVEESNSNFNFAKNKYDEKKLKDKLFGGIFGEEEFEKMDGTVGTSTKLEWVRSTETIKEGNFKTPEIKKLPPKGEAFEPFDVGDSASDDDLPF